MEFELYLRKALLCGNYRCMEVFKSHFKFKPSPVFLSHFVFYQMSLKDMLNVETKEGKDLLREQILIHSKSVDDFEINKCVDEIMEIIKQKVKQIKEFEISIPDSKYDVKQLGYTLFLSECSNQIDKIKVSKQMMNKLTETYTGNVKSKTFYLDVYKMLYRYDTLNLIAKSTMQLSMSDEYYERLKTKENVEFECFASPINRHLKKFCSAFYTTDKPFGSYGSIVNNIELILKNKNINLSSNPPYQLHAMNNHVNDVIKYMRENKTNGYKNKVFMILPYWEDAEYTKVLKDCELTKLFEINDKLVYKLFNVSGLDKKIIPCKTLHVILQNYE